MAYYFQGRIGFLLSLDTFTTAIMVRINMRPIKISKDEWELLRRADIELKFSVSLTKWLLNLRVRILNRRIIAKEASADVR